MNKGTEIIITPGRFQVAFPTFDNLVRLYEHIQKTVANGTAMSGEEDIEGIKKLFHSHGGQVSLATNKDTVTLYDMFKAKFRDEDSKKYYAERNEYAEYFGKTLYGDLQ